ncbi:MAG TPA: (2Fe-2S)-binding protein [Usitatibacter sp.]|nr:(2Fe-2S)-binding protein [Usitatibacter sp.]
MSVPPRSKDPSRPPGISRRDFLKGGGLAVASATALETGLSALAAPAAAAAPGAPEVAPVAGPGAVPIPLDVNGVPCVVEVAPSATLAEALRDGLGLTGTKVGCDRGACSACTVWLDGEPVASCMVLAIDVGARRITTIEGLSKGEELHPVQAAFIDHDAVQCGFCTPGLVMSCAALLGRNPHPSADEVRGAVSGHLCRCGTLPHAIAAVLDVAGKG